MSTRDERTDAGVTRRELLWGGAAAVGLSLLPPGRASAAAPAGYFQMKRVSGAATLSGTVRHGKARPRRKRLALSGANAAYCRRFHPRDESLVVGADGGIRGVVAFLEQVKRGKPVGGETPELSELGCSFVPHVLSITTGSRVLLHNQDPILNTFHAVTQPGGRTLFNVGLSRKGQKLRRRVRERGVIKVLCDVHPWELAYIVSVPHPYHAVTDGAGRFTLDLIPPGRYRLVLWHEKLGTQRRELTLAPGASARLKLTLR